MPPLRTVSGPYTKPLRSYPKRLNHGSQQQPSRCLTAFPPHSFLTIAALAAVGIPYYRVEHPCSNKVIRCFRPLRTNGEDRLSPNAPLIFLHWPSDTTHNIYPLLHKRQPISQPFGAQPAYRLPGLAPGRCVGKHPTLWLTFLPEARRIGHTFCGLARICHNSRSVLFGLWTAATNI